jgi:hypothetical protein
MGAGPQGGPQLIVVCGRTLPEHSHADSHFGRLRLPGRSACEDEGLTEFGHFETFDESVGLPQTGHCASSEGWRVLWESVPPG